MQEIRLNQKKWFLDGDKPLGDPGGFGQVFEGTDSENQQTVAVKRLHVDARMAAHRELDMVKGLVERHFEHVMPVLDFGLDAQSDNYYIVMPRADFSLKDTLESKGIFPDLEAIETLRQVAMGLREVGHIVHRDVKPGNVLFHEGRWKLSDFGIAKFIAEATSSQTVQQYRTPEYAAPEQWSGAGIASSTDIYALGCIGYELITGSPPFSGSYEELRRKHFQDQPPTLEGHSPRMQSLLFMMLRKRPEARPNLDRIIQLLTNIVEISSDPLPRKGEDLLAQANAFIISTAEQAESQYRKEQAIKAKRQELFNSARESLHLVAGHLFQKIKVLTPLAHDNVRADIGHFNIAFGGDTNMFISMFKPETRLPQNALFHTANDVAAGARILVTQGTPRYEYESNLWFVSTDGGSTYRWYEISYFDESNPSKGSQAINGFLKTYNGTNPFSRSAYGPRPIDDEDLDVFCDRWMELLAYAAMGRLQQLDLRINPPD
jgi:serine/threonine protein kinase